MANLIVVSIKIHSEINMLHKFNNTLNMILNLNIQRVCQIVILLFLCLLFSACSRRYHDVPTFLPISFSQYKNQGTGRFKSTLMAEQMAEYYRGSQPGPIAVATFVNVDDLQSSSTFGRIYAEQIMSELSMQGFDVIELRHSDALQFLNAEGEFALSRDVSVLKPHRELGGVVVGTYAISPVRVYVNARLLDPSSSRVLTVGSVEMSKTKEIARMVRGGSVKAGLERIPVKHLGFNTYPMNTNPYMAQAKQWLMEEQMGTYKNPEPAIMEAK